MSEYFGKEVPKLGFGLMRLTKKGVGKDIEQFKKLVLQSTCEKFF